MANTTDETRTFGEIIGYAPGGVAMHACNYELLTPEQEQDEAPFRSYVKNEYMGYKWQCVEFARRFLYINYGYVFTDVEMAYEIFSLRYLREVVTDNILPLQAYANGNTTPPRPGSLLIWEACGEFEATGHIAIITQVLPDKVRVAEQNVIHDPLPAGQQWTRELKLSRTNGVYRLEDTFDDTRILGWMFEVEKHDETQLQTDKNHADLVIKPETLPRNHQYDGQWLDTSDPVNQLYVEAYSGEPRINDDPYRYFAIGRNAEEELHKATNEVHLMYIHATDKVIRNDALLAYFDIPKIVWPRLKMSWQSRRHSMVSGRLDFVMDERGIKVYEYNADTASCHTEAGQILGDWLAHSELKKGRTAARSLLNKLVGVWMHNDAPKLVHVLHDEDPEESYHGAFLKSVLLRAGHDCETVDGMSSLTWDKSGRIIDSKGNLVTCVWKAWSWETAFDEIRKLDADEYAAVPIHTGKPDTEVRLVDILLRPEITIFEPLWTTIPGNKAILPILWSLFPNHPYLLRSEFELTEELKHSGYAVKPISGRCGANIDLVGNEDDLLDQTSGQFTDIKNIYQELWCLPKIDDLYIQVSTFTVAGNYGGACLRSDKSRVIKKESDVQSLVIR